MDLGTYCWSAVEQRPIFRFWSTICQPPAHISLQGVAPSGVVSAVLQIAVQDTPTHWSPSMQSPSAEQGYPSMPSQVDSEQMVWPAEMTHFIPSGQSDIQLSQGKSAVSQKEPLPALLN